MGFTDRVLTDGVIVVIDEINRSNESNEMIIVRQIIHDKEEVFLKFVLCIYE